jgi:hypothetical protein
MKLAVFGAFLMMIFFTVSSFSIMNEKSSEEDGTKVALTGDFGEGKSTWNGTILTLSKFF